MSKFKIALLCCLFLVNSLHAYTKSSFTSDKVWSEAEPYLLPHDHPLKAKLDQIFSQPNPLANEHSLRKAGFKFKRRPNKFMIVARHNKLKGHLVKIYLDDQTLSNGEWSLWLRRIKGAELVRKSIDTHGYHEWLKVPKKWVYALPPSATSKPGPNVFPKQYILLVEDMHVTTHGKNVAKYRFMMHEELLEALFTVLKENLLFDSMYLDNIPFCKDHKIAFIDTEHYSTGRKAMNYTQMVPRLSPKMQAFWKMLVER